MRTILSRAPEQAVLLLIAATCFAQPPQISPDTVKLTMAPVQGNVYVLMGDGGNITVQVGKDGVAMVDTGFAPLAPKAMAEIRKLSDGPIRWIVNTHVHTDHTGGNAEMAKLGMTPESVGPPRIIAQSNVLNRMTTPAPGEPKIPEAAWPNDEYFLPSKDFFVNGEAVVVYHLPNAHTDGDSIVFFRKSDVLSTGDVFAPDLYPIIDLALGGSVQGEIDALNRIIDITVPAKYQEGGTMVIPGHGRLCDEADVVEYRNMLTIIRDRFQDMIHKGMTLEQIKATKPTLDYDPEYGATTGFWTTDQFIEAVYKNLSQKRERETLMRRIAKLVSVASFLIFKIAPLLAQGVPPPSGIGPPGRPQQQKSAQAAAPVDFTGYWVSVVSEDWRWRMVTPIRGDFASIPLNNEGRKVGNAWDPYKDAAAGEQCRSYGAPAIMRVPGRVHVTWGDENTLKVETDAGTQTRMFHFTAHAPESGERTQQGYSAAHWEQPVRGSGAPGFGLGATREGAHGKSLEVVTTQLRGGYLRKNGPPYSENTVLKEYYDLHKEPNGDTWFTVTTIVTDPTYLTEPFVTSTDFKKIPDAAGWSPSACVAK